MSFQHRIAIIRNLLFGILVKPFRMVQTGIVLLFAVYFTFVAFENIINPSSNLVFLEHVLSMDTTFGTSMWKATDNPAAFHTVYSMIIAVELAAAAFCWVGAANMIRRFNEGFADSKQFGILGLGCGMILFLLFVVIGGEWFMMWQSSEWSAQTTAYHMIIILGVMLLLLRKDI